MARARPCGVPGAAGRIWLSACAGLLLFAGPALAGDPAPPAADGAGPEAGSGAAGETVFLAAPEAGDLRATDWLGAVVYAADDGLADMAGNTPIGMLARSLPRQKLGVVVDLLLTGDGAMRAVLVDVGRFVRETGKTVAIPPESFRPAGNWADPADRALLLAATRDSLRLAPAFETPGRGAKPLAMTPAAGMAAPGGGAKVPLAAAGAGASAMAGQGYRHAATGDLTPRMLRNSDVYGMDGERIGAVRSVVETDSGIITGIVVEIGGLLGMGGRAIALPMRDLTVLRQADGDRLRVRANVTKAQIQALPRHRN